MKKTSKKISSQKVPSFPVKLLTPVSRLLKSQLKSLENRKRNLEKDDPFQDQNRLTDNISMDDEASEQFGHAQVVAVKEQVDKQIVRVRKALTMIKIGKYGICDDCGKMIDTNRLMIEPEATFCANCQRKREK